MEPSVDPSSPAATGNRQSTRSNYYPMLSDLLKWGKRGDAADIAVPKGAEVVVTSKAFPKFLTAARWGRIGTGIRTCCD